MARKRFTAEHIIIKLREQRAGLMNGSNYRKETVRKLAYQAGLAVGVASETRRPKTV